MQYTGMWKQPSYGNSLISRTRWALCIRSVHGVLPGHLKILSLHTHLVLSSTVQSLFQAKDMLSFTKASTNQCTASVPHAQSDSTNEACRRKSRTITSNCSSDRARLNPVYWTKPSLYLIHIKLCLFFYFNVDFHLQNLQLMIGWYRYRY